MIHSIHNHLTVQLYLIIKVCNFVYCRYSSSCRLGHPVDYLLCGDNWTGDYSDMHDEVAIVLVL